MSLAYPLPKGTRQVVPDYICDGATIYQFSIPFRFFDPTDIYIGFSTVAGGPWTQQTLGVNYTISGAGLEAGGVATFTIIPAAGFMRVMGLRTPSRLTSVTNDGAMISSAFENELDVQEMTLQELRRDVNAEVIRAEAAEAALAASIAAETVRAEAAEAAETTRAEAAEAAETTRAEAAEAAIAASAAAATRAETTRAEAAEAAETRRAETAEAGLAAWIGVLAQSWLFQLLQLPAPASLPTSEPAGAGIYWSDGRVLCVTPGGSLPTSMPGGAGSFWSNGGVVCVTAGGITPLAPALPAAAGLYWNDGGVICIS